jgi:2-oxo-4-hydroxy-4-carboxy--5-ureidoimidazoline (OHCU) decarboxylase
MDAALDQIERISLLRLKDRLPSALEPLAVG